MRSFRSLVMVVGLLIIPLSARAAEKPKRLLLVTHSLGFIHDSVGVAEMTLKELGPKNGFEVTCYRFTGDPTTKVKFRPKKDAPEQEVTVLEKYSADFRARTGLTVEKENCGRVNAETLKQFDVVLFFTTGNPLNESELKDLQAWVKAGGAFTGTHCASDTLYNLASYGELIGAYFKGHPPGIQKIKLNVEDPKHPAAVGLTQDMPYDDEIYVFRDLPYSRDRLHIILSTSDGSFDPKNLKRSDSDYAISWCREEGKGKVFYTSLGHRKGVWTDPKYQAHLFGGIKWAVGELPGDATPSAKLK